MAVGFRLYRNGVEVVPAFHGHHYGGIQLTQVAYDGEVGVGSLTIPGDLDWDIGDRISFTPMADDAAPFFTGYLISPNREEDAIEALVAQTGWQLNDHNRAALGKRQVHIDFPTGYALDDLTATISGLFGASPQPTIDDTTYVDTDATIVFPPKTYTHDGWTGYVEDIVKYTGKTVFLGLTATENTLALHVHDLTDGITSSLTISDDPSALADPDTFAPQKPRRAVDGSTVKDVVEISNMVTTVIGGTPIHTAGGLQFEFVIESGLSEDDMDILADTLTSTVEKATYSMTIGPLTSEQCVTGVQAGMLIPVTSETVQVSDTRRIANVTLRVAQDESGNFLPGLWNADLELDFPTRDPVSASYQAWNPLGQILENKEWNGLASPRVDDPQIGVGELSAVTTQLIYKKKTAPSDQDVALADTGIPVAIAGVTVYWGLEQEDALGYAGTDYSLNVTSSLTDESGMAENHVARVSDFGVVRFRVVVSSEPFS